MSDQVAADAAKKLPDSPAKPSADALRAAMMAAGLLKGGEEPRAALSQVAAGAIWDHVVPAVKSAARGDARRLIEGRRDPASALTAAGYSPSLAARILADLGRR